LKVLVDVLRNAPDHWVGDGFPVRTVFFYDQRARELSPFLLLDYVGPYHFEAASRPRVVGPRPHRGLELVTTVYNGEITHRDSTGSSGTIGPGDVQWMTAGAGVLHHELQSAFAKAGGLFRMVELWVNLPADLKLTPPKYQSIKANKAPVIELKGGAGRARIIAGSLYGRVGPAKTFTALNVWDLELNSKTRVVVDAPEGHTALILVLSGALAFKAEADVCDAEAALLSRSGEGALLRATAATNALVLTGAPIDEPIVGRGPFVMNTEREIRQAFRDFGSGRFGAIEQVGQPPPRRRTLD
jgi:quercetin 2,3-dioxygenase